MHTLGWNSGLTVRLRWGPTAFGEVTKACAVLKSEGLTNGMENTSDWIGHERQSENSVMQEPVSTTDAGRFEFKQSALQIETCV